MAPHKKGKSKQRDVSPKPSNVSTQDLGFTLSPARTPKKLLRNKKRKELIESLSPSPSPKKKSKLSSKSPRQPNSNKKNAVDSASANTPSILSYFTKAKPVQYVECPVCSSQVAMSKVNRHLDNNCLIKEEEDGGTSSGLSKNSNISSKDEESKTGSTSKKKTKKDCSPGRKKADLKMESKDKKTRLRLKKKIKSHALYQQTTSVHGVDSSDRPIVIDSSDSVVESASVMQNESDVESTSSMQQTATVHVKPKKKVHRELFSDGDNNNNRSTSGKSRTKSKLSLKRRQSSEKEEKSTSKLSLKKKQIDKNAAVSKSSSKAKTETASLSSYWSNSTSSSSEDCVIVRSTPGKEKLSLSQKISLQLSPTKDKKQVPSCSYANESSTEVPGTLTQETSCTSPDGKDHPKGGLQETINRSPKKLTPVSMRTFKSPLTKKTEGNMLKDSKYSSSSSGKPSSTISKLSTTTSSSDKPSSTVSKLPKAKPVIQNLPQSSPNKSLHSPHKNTLDNSPSTSRTLYSPSKYRPSTSTHTTPVNSPMKSSQALSPASSTASSMNTPSKRDPYYLANFKLIFLTVLGCEDDRSLFSDEDLAYVDTFKNLSGK